MNAAGATAAWTGHQELIVRLTIAEPYHIYANDIGGGDVPLIPTR